LWVLVVVVVVVVLVRGVRPFSGTAELNPLFESTSDLENNFESIPKNLSWEF
jgi:hypothetical protein